VSIGTEKKSTNSFCCSLNYFFKNIFIKFIRDTIIDYMGTVKKMAIGLCFIASATISAQETLDQKTLYKQAIKQKASEKEALAKEVLLEKNKEYQKESISNIKITKYTVMSKFEPDYVTPAEERIEQKRHRIVETYRKKNILDTLNISERKRKKLLQDLRNSPFSDRLSKSVIVNTKFEDE